MKMIKLTVKPIDCDKYNVYINADRIECIVGNEVKLTGNNYSYKVEESAEQIVKMLDD